MNWFNSHSTVRIFLLTMGNTLKYGPRKGESTRKGNLSAKKRGRKEKNDNYDNTCTFVSYDNTIFFIFLIGQLIPHDESTEMTRSLNKYGKEKYVFKGFLLTSNVSSFLYFTFSVVIVDEVFEKRKL